MTSAPSIFVAVRRAVVREIGTIAVFSMCLNLLMLAVPLYMLQVYERVLTSGHVETLVLLTVLVGGALATFAVLEIVRGRLLARTSSFVEAALAGDVLRQMLRARLQGVGDEGQLLRDLGTARNALQGNGIHALLDAPWAPVFLLAVWLLHPLLGMVALAAAAVLLLLALMNDLLTRRLMREATGSQLKVQQQADNMVRNADAVHALGMTAAFVRRLDRGRQVQIDRQLQAADRSALFVGLARFGRLFAQVALLATGAWLTLGDALTPGGIIAASMLFGRGMAPVEQATAAWRGSLSGWLAWRRIETALGGLDDRPMPVRLPEAEGRLTMAAVTFVPPGVGRPVLEEVSLDLARGEVCGVVGPSAAGKTTLCRLAVGTARPSAGEVRIDGMEIGQWDPTHLGSRIGYLPQDVELFEGTVAENIARMGDAASEDILEAATLAGVHDMVLRLPNGYATALGPRGEPLSGGQRQRIGLARALFGKPALLVLDEPNASLDAEGEAALVEALRAVRERGVTVLMVVHKASLLRGCDRIACLRDGRLCLYGERDEVLPMITGEARGAAVVAPAAENRPARHRAA